jgi:hypothetical protein
MISGPDHAGSQVMSVQARAPLPAFHLPLGAQPGHHAVQFYDRDDGLLDSLTDYIAAGLACGAAAVVIATLEHAQELALRLEARGFSLPP